MRAFSVGADIFFSLLACRMRWNERAFISRPSMSSPGNYDAVLMLEVAEARAKQPARCAKSGFLQSYWGEIIKIITDL